MRSQDGVEPSFPKEVTARALSHDGRDPCRAPLLAWRPPPVGAGWVARDARLDREVAMKGLSEELEDDDERLRLGVTQIAHS